MRKLIIVALICVNLVLVAAVAFHARAEKAYAQRARGGANYTMITSRRDSGEDVVYVVDTNRRIMMGWWADISRPNQFRLVALGPRDLERDFPVGGR